MQPPTLGLLSALKILAAAVVLASFVSASVAAIIAPLFDVREIGNILGSALLYFLYILIFDIFIGVPTAIILYSLDVIIWRMWLPIALVSGFLVTFLFMNARVADDLPGYALIMSLSVLSAMIFRFVWEVLGIRRAKEQGHGS